MITQEWIDRLFTAVDGMNTDAYISFLTDDCELIFGNSPAVSGKANIYPVIQGFFDSIKGLKHSVNEWFESEGRLVSRGKVKYTRLDGESIESNFCNVFLMEGELVKHYQIYVDISMLYA